MVSSNPSAQKRYRERLKVWNAKRVAEYAAIAHLGTALTLMGLLGDETAKGLSNDDPLEMLENVRRYFIDNASEDIRRNLPYPSNSEEVSI